MNSKRDWWNRDGKHSNCWPQWGCFDIRWRQQTNLKTSPLIRIAIMQTSHWRKHILNVDTISGGCCGSTSKKTVVGGWAWAWWLVTDVQRWGLGRGYKRISYSRWIHYADINEIWIPNQTFYWIPLKTTKFDLLSLKLSAHLRVVKDAINSSLTTQWLHCRNICRLSLEVMTLNPICENVETAQGVPLTVTGVAQVSSNSLLW